MGSAYDGYDSGSGSIELPAVGVVENDGHAIVEKDTNDPFNKCRESMKITAAEDPGLLGHARSLFETFRNLFLKVSRGDTGQ